MYQNPYTQLPSSTLGGASSGFLDSQLQQNMAPQRGLMQGQFNNVMSSLSGSVTQNAQQGVLPGQSGKLTPQQVAAQMQTGGVMSVLPQLGGSFMPKLIMPVAGAFSIVDGLRTLGSMKKELRDDAASNQRFDPSQLSYNRAMEQYEETLNATSHLY